MLQQIAAHSHLLPYQVGKLGIAQGIIHVVAIASHLKGVVNHHVDNVFVAHPALLLHHSVKSMEAHVLYVNLTFNFEL